VKGETLTPCSVLIHVVERQASKAQEALALYVHVEPYLRRGFPSIGRSEACPEPQSDVREDDGPARVVVWTVSKVGRLVRKGVRDEVPVAAFGKAQLEDRKMIGGEDGFERRRGPRTSVRVDIARSLTGEESSRAQEGADGPAALNPTYCAR
jgi:hypothetical protein